MTVRAVLRDGSEVELAARLGATLNEVVAGLTKDSLTGSAVPLADAELELTDGRKVPYCDVNTFEDVQGF